jgi:hypothetical protein
MGATFRKEVSNEQNEELLATAYHEAGHAVIAYLHGRRFKSMSIDPENCSGSVKFYDGRIIAEILDGTHCNIWLFEHPDEETRIVDRDILSTMAGYISQDMGIPGSVEPYKWEADREQLAEILSRIPSSNEWDKAEAMVRRELKDNWYLVEGLAQKIIERKTLAGKEVRSILNRMKEELPPRSESES